MPSGFTLRYLGEHFAHPSSASNPVDELKKNFSNIGALVMRFQLSQAQYAAILQQITESDYQDHPIDKPGNGNNESCLFHPSEINMKDASDVTKLLEEYAHYPIGRGKLLNERGQGLKHHNSNGFCGGQYLWDMLHFTVWQTGINLSYSLSKQGFLYIHCPANTSKEKYDELSAQLALGNFKILAGEPMILQTVSGESLIISAVPKTNEIEFDEEHNFTFQENGFVIKNEAQASKEPIGWMIHKDKLQILNSEMVENLLRVIRIAKAGFHLLSPSQQVMLESGLLGSTGQTVFTQNRSFNAMSEIFTELQKNYSFDPGSLLDNKRLQVLYKNVHNDAEQKNLSETLLILDLVFEMTQPLFITQEQSPRPKLPWNLQNSFSINHNTIKAIAYAFELTMKGEPILDADKDHPIEDTADLIDVKVNGSLHQPIFIDNKNAAAILSVAILVAEQMLIEQLLSSACRLGDDHPYSKALRDIVGPTFYQSLKSAAVSLPSDNNGPLLGSQFTHCNDILSALRQHLGFNHLIDMAIQLYNDKTYSPSQNECSYFEKLLSIGERLQECLPEKQTTRGINAGLIPFAKKFFPELQVNNAVAVCDKLDPEVLHPSPVQSAAIKLTGCPFLDGKMNKDLCTKSEANKSYSSNWSNLFNQEISCPAKDLQANQLTNRMVK